MQDAGAKDMCLIKYRPILKRTIECAGAEALAKALPACTSLHSLWLQGNKIGDTGAEALAKVLPACASLRDLYLGDNNIGDTGKAAVKKAQGSCLSVWWVRC